MTNTEQTNEIRISIEHIKNNVKTIKDLNKLIEDRRK